MDTVHWYQEKVHLWQSASTCWSASILLTSITCVLAPSYERRSNLSIAGTPQVLLFAERTALVCSRSSFRPCHRRSKCGTPQQARRWRSTLPQISMIGTPYPPRSNEVLLERLGHLGTCLKNRQSLLIGIEAVIEGCKAWEIRQTIVPHELQHGQGHE